MDRNISLAEWKERENAARIARGEPPLSNDDIYDMLDAEGPPLDPVVNKNQVVSRHLRGTFESPKFFRPDADFERRYLAITSEQVTPLSWYEQYRQKEAVSAEKDAA